MFVAELNKKKKIKSKNAFKIARRFSMNAHTVNRYVMLNNPIKRHNGDLLYIYSSPFKNSYFILTDDDKNIVDFCLFKTDALKEAREKGLNIIEMSL